MRQWLIKAGATDIDGLVQVDVAMPDPGPGEVRVQVRAISMNYRDQLILKGVMGRLSGRDLVPASDMSGEIDAVGDGVTAWALGDRVTSLMSSGWVDGPPPGDLDFGLGAYDMDGVLAKYVVLPASRIIRASSTLSHIEAATLPVAAVTAWNALYGAHPIRPGSKVLVQGSGAVSLFGLLIARVAGAEVSATTGDAAKADRLKALGAVNVTNYRDEPDFGKALFGRTGGFDKVLETVGPGNLDQSLAALGPAGEVVMIGLLAMDAKPLDAMALFMKRGSIRAIATGSTRMHEALVRAIDLNGIKPPIHRRFAFDDVPAAYRAQLQPDLFGKIVITPD